MKADIEEITAPSVTLKQGWFPDVCVSAHSEKSGASILQAKHIIVYIATWNIEFLAWQMCFWLSVFLYVSLSQVEEKQRASVAFSKLLIAMQTLGFTASEQKAIWHVLAGIYHLGAAGACRGNTDSSLPSPLLTDAAAFSDSPESQTGSLHRQLHWSEALLLLYLNTITIFMLLFYTFYKSLLNQRWANCLTDGLLWVVKCGENRAGANGWTIWYVI